MGKKIFISYRRGDSADVTGRVDDHLVKAFGRRVIFKDVDSIPLGTDFRKVLSQAVGKCDVLLVVIGSNWLGALDESGNRRLDDEEDYVRIEIETALRRNIPIIPLLLGDIPMVKPEQLPEPVRELAYRNGTRVRQDPDFHSDMERVVKAIRATVRQRPVSEGGNNGPKVQLRKTISIVIICTFLIVTGIGIIALWVSNFSKDQRVTQGESVAGPPRTRKEVDSPPDVAPKPAEVAEAKTQSVAPKPSELTEAVPHVATKDADKSKSPEPISQPNRPPTVEIAGFEPAEPVAGGTLTVSFAGSDPDGDHLTYQYRTDPKGEWQPVPDGRVLLSNLKPGFLQLEVRTVDSRGLPSEFIYSQRWSVRQDAAPKDTGLVQTSIEVPKPAEVAKAKTQGATPNDAELMKASSAASKPTEVVKAETPTPPIPPEVEAKAKLEAARRAVAEAIVTAQDAGLVHSSIDPSPILDILITGRADDEGAINALKSGGLVPAHVSPEVFGAWFTGYGKDKDIDYVKQVRVVLPEQGLKQWYNDRAKILKLYLEAARQNGIVQDDAIPADIPADVKEKLKTSRRAVAEAIVAAQDAGLVHSSIDPPPILDILVNGYADDEGAINALKSGGPVPARVSPEVFGAWFTGYGKDKDIDYVKQVRMMRPEQGLKQYYDRRTAILNQHMGSHNHRTRNNR